MRLSTAFSMREPIIWNICTIVFYRVYCIRRYPDETKIAFCRDRSLYRGIFQFTGSDLICSALKVISCGWMVMPPALEY